MLDIGNICYNLENTEATQEEVDAAVEALNAALEALVEAEEDPVDPDAPGKTGDDSLIMAFALLMILSAAAICAIITLNKRMNIR